MPCTKVCYLQEVPVPNWYWYHFKKYCIILFHSLKVLLMIVISVKLSFLGIVLHPEHDYSQQNSQSINAIKYH